MAYVYKKIIHGKPYYYLRLSERVKGKIIVKDIAYLGGDASEIEGKLKDLPKVYKKEIRDAYRNINKFIKEEYFLKKVRKLKLKENSYLDKKFLEEIEAIKLHFNTHFLKRDKKTAEETFKNFLIDFAFNTTSLEGNTITLAEANKLLREKLTPKNRTLREIYDLQNTQNVFFEIINFKKEINHDFIIQIHDKLLDKIDERKGYRAHDIRVFGSHFEATPFPYIKADMDILLKWYGKYENQLHPLALAGIFHQKFEKIHPFSDGNKRSGSFLFIYFLDKNNFLYKKSGEKKINDNALTALALLVAESDPKEKDLMIKLIMNLLG